jgi:GNAT superfamily N-acetyltransferase
LNGQKRNSRLLQAIKQRGIDFLYSLIQPRRVPDGPRGLPRIRTELLVTALGLIGWAIFLGYHDRVSPTASLELRHDRGQIAGLAEAYLQERGVDLGDYRRVATFGVDGMAQIYLERVVGVPRMNQLVQEGEIPLWHWRVRWFVPGQKEEYRVELRPTGEVAGFAHVVAEDAPAPSVPLEKARQIANRYLAADRGLDLDDWELYDASTQTLPRRSDHTLTWVKRGVTIGDGDVRVSVTVQGDEVGRFDNWFRVPETFYREYREQRSRAWLLDNAATIAATAFTLGGVLIVAWGLFNGLKIGWMPLIVGLLAGLVDLLDSLNWLPLIGAGYDTALDYHTYLLERLTAYAGSAAFNVAFVAFLALSGKWLLRAVWPGQHKLVPEAGDRWRHLARSGWRGMMLGGLMGAYLVMFYAVAHALGAWSPVRTPSLNLLATPFPFIAAVAIGLLPALKEELTYRALGIGLTMRATKGRVWLALLLPSLLWGFAHASYLTDPIGLRGIELTLSSLLLTGLFFLLFDLTTTVVAHYTYNASLTSIILVRSDRPAFVITGVMAALLGLLPAAILLVRRLAGREGGLPPVSVSAGGEEDWAAARELDGDWIAEERQPRRLVYLHAADGRMRGYAVGVIEEKRATERVGVVSRLFVAGPYRDRGWDAALYRALEDWFRAQGARRIEVDVPLGDAEASTFWLSQQFRPRTRSWQKSLSEAE